MRTFVLTSCLALVACAADGGAPATGLANTQWIAQSVAGNPVAPPGAISLNFKEGSAHGNSGCNSYTGLVIVSGSLIKFRNMASTMMACLDPGRTTQEATYLFLLRDAVTFERQGEVRLEIVTADGRRVVFAAKR